MIKEKTNVFGDQVVLFDNIEECIEIAKFGVRVHQANFVILKVEIEDTVKFYRMSLVKFNNKIIGGEQVGRLVDMVKPD